MKTIFKAIQSKVQELYPEAIILDIAETFYPENGWVNTEKTINPYRSIQEVERAIKGKISKGATHFNFKITDEFGQVRYPDYSVKELLKDTTL